jgi:hypothetical protein
MLPYDSVVTLPSEMREGTQEGASSFPGCLFVQLPYGTRVQLACPGACALHCPLSPPVRATGVPKPHTLALARSCSVGWVRIVTWP